MELLQYYSKADVQAIATQLAVLEVVTYHNAIATGASQGRQKTQEAINWVSRKFINKGLVAVRSAPSLTDQVVHAAEENARRPKNELASRVLSILAERLNCPTVELERLSTLVVREAAEGLDIDEDLLVGQQAEQVAKKYWEDCLEGIRKHLHKQNAEEARRMEQTISDRLSTLTPTERLELQKTLQLSDLSGAAVRRAFLQAGGPLAGIAAVNMVGFGAYIALSVIIHAIFTTILGVTLPFAFYTSASSLLSFLTGPFGVVLALGVGAIGYAIGNRKLNRAQFAMIVWTCVTHSSAPLYAQTAFLPSAVTTKQLPASIQNERNCSTPEQNSDRELAARESEANSAKETSAKAEKELRGERSVAQALQKKVLSIQADLARARIREANTAAEIERKTATISRFSAEQARLEAEVHCALEKVRAAEQRSATLESALHAAEQRYEQQVEGRREQIEKLWAVHFPKFHFSTKALRWVAQKTFAERLEVERALLDLREAKDPVALSRGKMNGTDQHHSGFMLAPKTPARIYYRWNSGRLEITQMLKKNETHTFAASA